jgi:hypothetical protein
MTLLGLIIELFNSSFLDLHYYFIWQNLTAFNKNEGYIQKGQKRVWLEIKIKV